MEWKKIGKKLLFPPFWVMVVMTLFSAAALIFIFIKGWEQTVPACFAYAVAFYTLTVVTAFCVWVLPKQYRQLKAKALAIPVVNRYATDRVFRTSVSLYLSLIINLLYVGLNLFSWYTIGSWWFMVLAVYYTILAVMRFLLVRYKKPLGASMPDEWKHSRLCACILLLVNFSLSGAVLMILYQSKGYDYGSILIYVMALYTFYSTIHAAVDIVKFRKLGSPILTTAKTVSLCAALVSMLNLETAMFAQFGGEMAVSDQRIFIILTGAGVSITVVALSVILIVKATKEIRYGR